MQTFVATQRHTVVVADLGRAEDDGGLPDRPEPIAGDRERGRFLEPAAETSCFTEMRVLEKRSTIRQTCAARSIRTVVSRGARAALRQL